MVIRAEIGKMLLRITNREDPDKTAVCLGLFGKATSVCNFRASTIVPSPF